MLRFLAISGVMLTCLLAPRGPRAVAVFQEPGAKPATNSDVVIVEHCRIKFAQRATLASGQMGILKSVLQKEGLPVQENKPVAAVDDSVQQARIIVATEEAKNKIDILYAKKAVELAKTEVEKAEAVNRDIEGTVPDIEVLKLKLAAERGALQVGLAEHEARVKELQLKLAETELKTFVINAPFNGIVTKVFKHQGEAVRQGDPIVEIVNPNVIRAEGTVLLKDAWRIKTGDTVVLEPGKIAGEVHHNAGRQTGNVSGQSCVCRRRRRAVQRKSPRLGEY